MIDEGAARALREGSASLLPVGIVAVEGKFDAGDAVEIAGTAGTETIAKGICNYSADELKRVIGMKTEAVRGILPHATDEAVHRDYLVVG